MADSVHVVECVGSGWRSLGRGGCVEQRTGLEGNGGVGGSVIGWGVGPGVLADILGGVGWVLPGDMIGQSVMGGVRAGQSGAGWGGWSQGSVWG